ncbi:hypothetical protein [Gelidibacter japonicus]|uniref:hypothetical protein n=1 Tax=Gelidibacter japonicus TaxID=1962232 RepID=UPI0013D82A7F|nr:hypothetical protein [Gelidibacter japonicus]
MDAISSLKEGNIFYGPSVNQVPRKNLALDFDDDQCDRQILYRLSLGVSTATIEC